VELVVVPVFLMTSGARYSGVPQSVYVSPANISPRSLSWVKCILFSTFFAKPKSTSLRWPSASMRMFSGFRSRYATPSVSCRNSRMSTISAA
jgi:hypothetical protein